MSGPNALAAVADWVSAPDLHKAYVLQKQTNKILIGFACLPYTNALELNSHDGLDNVIPTAECLAIQTL